VLAIFDRDHCSAIDFQTRLAAANALGQAGDPRLNENNWIPIQPGTFWMGEKTNKRNRRKVTLPQDRPFEIARYPVTVSEYALFVDDDGYNDRQWWEGTRGLLDRDRSEPWGWDGQRGRQNHPVIGVSWYEAQAYCRWRTAQERLVAPAATGVTPKKQPLIRLLSEAEWEYVARGGDNDRPYPWGDQEPDGTLANYDYTNRGTTPVGLYPLVATPEGVCDLAGNVGEWVEDEDRNEEQPLRVLRGGSYFSEEDVLRSGARWRDSPAVKRFSNGLRVAREWISV
jgi:formylglycine-generating enzyme required for sulfatase activity